jgi:hypothetical protein
MQQESQVAVVVNVPLDVVPPVPVDVVAVVPVDVAPPVPVDVVAVVPVDVVPPVAMDVVAVVPVDVAVDVIADEDEEPWHATRSIGMSKPMAIALSRNNDCVGIVESWLEFNVVSALKLARI